MKTLNTIFLLTILLLPSITTAASDFLFHSLDTQQGLSNNSVNAMMVDSRGYLWIGTAMGLNRYDGYEVKNINYFSQGNTLPAADVRRLSEDAAGNIWIEYNGTTARYNTATQTCHSDNADYFKSLGLTSITDRYSIITDERRNLWILCSGRIFYYDYSLRKLLRWNSGLKQTARDWQLTPCAEGLYLCDEHEVWKFVSKTGKTQRISLPDAMDGSGNRLRTYVDTDNSLWVYSMISEAIYHHKGAQLSLPLTGGSNAIRDIYDDDHGNLWIATDHNGVFIVNRQDNTTQHLLHKHNSLTSISSDNITCIAADRQGTVWLGHFKTGVSYTNTHFSRFQSRGQQFGDVSIMLHDRNGNLWLGTDGNGVFIEHADGTYSKASLPNVTISSLLEDHSGTMWVGTYNNGLCRMQGNSVSKTYTMENHHLPSNAIWQMAEDNHHNIWIASGFSPLMRFNIDSEKAALVQHKNATVLGHSVVFDGKHTVYVGTYYGVWAYDTNKGKGDFILGNRRGTQSFLLPAIVSLCYDKQRDALWMAHTTGISVLDIKKDSLSYIDKSNGLSDCYVKTIVQDKMGNMWLSTGHGISCVRITKGGECVVHNFTTNEELQNSFFNTFAATCSPRGEILMGGNEGYTMISPNNIFRDSAKPKLMLTEVMVGDSCIIPIDNEVHLSYDDHLIEFRFFTGSLISANRTLYAYRIKDMGNEWIYTDKNKISFFSLNHGTHIIEIKAANENGEWGDVTTITVYVKPPFYLSWWMITLYVIAIIAFFVITYRMMRHRQQKRIQEQRLRMEQGHKVELSEMKLRFFTNISHDLRTPLTLIVSPLQSLIEELKSVSPQLSAETLASRINNRLTVMHKNAQLLMAQVNMLLDFRRLDVGGETLHLQSIDVAQHIGNICLSFQDYAQERTITLSYTPSEQHVFAYVDAEKLSKVMYNLLSNAFKFTPDGGKISVSLGIQESNLLIRVADTGCGIPDDSKQQVFQRFYQVRNDDPKAGSGIGLHIVNEYIKMHGGTIEVSDNNPQGTVFSITIPMEAAAQEAPTTVSCASTQGTTTSATVSCASTQDNHTTILVVDDNHDLCSFIADSLRTAYPDYDILTAPDGQEALHILQKQDVSLVITDIMMPKVDGMELCRRIKTTITWSHIPVIMLTAKATDVNVIDGLKLGADDYITKPFNIEHLKLRIEKFLEWTRNTHETFQRKIEIEPSEITITSLDEEFIKKAISIVEDHMSDSDFSVELFGKELNMSRANLYKKMMSITGKGPHDFMRSIRLKRAHQLLEKSQRQISEIAYEVGFSSPKRFSENFKAEFGMTPSEFVRSTTHPNPPQGREH